MKWAGALLLLLALHGRASAVCCGDCNGDSTVTDPERAQCLAIFQGMASLSTCVACDCNGDGDVQSNEYTEVVMNMTGGCPPPAATFSPSFTPTRTATPTQTPTGATATPTDTPTGATPTVTPTAVCCGDCNLDGTVLDAERELCLGILSGTEPLSACPACDCNGDGDVLSNEYTQIILHNQIGCPGEPTKTFTAVPTTTPTPICCGDCNHDGSIDAVEFNHCVAILDGTEPVSACPACDCNGDGDVLSDEITQIVIHHDTGCPGQPTHTATPFVPPTPSPTAVCCGDCNLDGSVEPEERAACLNILNGSQNLMDCPACDCNGDGDVLSNEFTIITINNVSGCPGQPTKTMTRTVTPTNTPGVVVGTPTPAGLPCAPGASCSPQGSLTLNLGLCKPASGEPNWDVYFNADFDRLDRMFPNCVLQPQNGGTGTGVQPSAGALLVGDAVSGHYEVLPGGLDTQWLVADSTAAHGVKWGYPASTAQGAPDPAQCTGNAQLGKLVVDVVDGRLYVCAGSARGWDYVALNP